MSTIRTRVTRLSVAAALTLGLGFVGAAPALAGSQTWAGRPAPPANDEGSWEGAAIQSSNHGIDDAGGLEGNITAI